MRQNTLLLFLSHLACVPHVVARLRGECLSGGRWWWWWCVCVRERGGGGEGGAHPGRQCATCQFTFVAGVRTLKVLGGVARVVVWVALIADTQLGTGNSLRRHNNRDGHLQCQVIRCGSPARAHCVHRVLRAMRKSVRQRGPMNN